MKESALQLEPSSGQMRSRAPAGQRSQNPESLQLGFAGSILSLQQSIGNYSLGCALRAAGMQPKLHISQPGDPYEQEADRIADQVMRMHAPSASSPALSLSAPSIQRKCSACAAGGKCSKCGEEERSLHRKVQAGSSTASAHSGTHEEGVVPSSFLNGLGPGRPLDTSLRGTLEPRFGHDFSDVRIHTDVAAFQSADAVNALAYTVGSNIAFGRGQFNPSSGVGLRLLSHELTHVIQQGGGHPHPISSLSNTFKQAPALAVQRSIRVTSPTAKIDKPGGKGLDQTNARTIEDYLASLCGTGKVGVNNGTGAVSIDKSFCTQPSLPAGVSGPAAPSRAQASATATGCGCLCDLVSSSHDWRIQVDDKNWPHTDFDDPSAAVGTTPGGTGGQVTAPSPNSSKLWGAGTVSGKELDIDPWLVLGHELCGHAWMGDTGGHAADIASPRGEGGHQETVKRENLIRKEHGIEARGGFKDPNCGESYFRDKAAPGKVNWSSFRAQCENWRKAYNKAHGTKYKITDQIP